MRLHPAALPFFLCLTSAAAFGSTITYDVVELSSGAGLSTWEYTYQLSDLPSTAVGFDIFFPVSLGFQFGDLSNPVSNSDWIAITLQADPNLPADGMLDAIALAAQPGFPATFSVDFTWRNAYAPASQAYQLFDANFNSAASGNTIPATTTTVAVAEPETSLLLFAGLPLLASSRKKR